MTAIARRAGLSLLLIAAVASGGAVIARAQAPRTFLGACYCRAGETLKCTSNLTEPEWFWKERLPCWNWGYGG